MSDSDSDFDNEERNARSRRPVKKVSYRDTDSSNGSESDSDGGKLTRPKRRTHPMKKKQEALSGDDVSENHDMLDEESINRNERMKQRFRDMHESANNGNESTDASNVEDLESEDEVPLAQRKINCDMRESDNNGKESMDASNIADLESDDEMPLAQRKKKKIRKQLRDDARMNPNILPAELAHLSGHSGSDNENEDGEGEEQEVEECVVNSRPRKRNTAPVFRSDSEDENGYLSEPESESEEEKPRSKKSKRKKYSSDSEYEPDPEEMRQVNKRTRRQQVLIFSKDIIRVDS